MTGADIYMKTCKEKALEWNVSPRSVNDMCKKGRIQGAIKEKGSWLIPDDSPKPMDGRVSNGKYIKKNMVAKAEVKSLPIGISDCSCAGRILLCRQDVINQRILGSKAIGIFVYETKEIRKDLEYGYAQSVL